MSLSIDPVALEWQRRLDPSRFNKKTGAKFHTAPSVVFPGAPDYPDDAPAGSVTILFYVDGEGWLCDPRRMTIDDPIVVEKAPRTKGTKNGSVIFMTPTQAILIVGPTQNYYWSAKILAENTPWRISLAPGRGSTDKKRPKVKVTATFIPSE